MKMIVAFAFTLWSGLAVAQGGGLASALVEHREVDLSYPAEGVVEAVRQATVAAQVQGRILEVRVDVGDRVKAGDVLMRVDPREAAQGVAGADAGVAQAEAGLANARAAYERTQNLFTQKFVSQSALDAARSAYRAAEAQLKTAQAGRGQATTTQSFTTITAPIDGVVAERHTDKGEMASPGKELLTLYGPGELRVTAEVPQYKLGDVRRTLRAKVEFPESGRWVDAGSVTVLPTADARTHTVRVRVSLPEDAAGAVPGLFARVHFITGRAKKLLVPGQTILRRGEVSAVYVMNEKGETRLRQVRLGEKVADGSVEVLAGLAAGERVALEPVRAGMALKKSVAKS